MTTNNGVSSVYLPASRRSPQPASVSGPAQSDKERAERTNRMATEAMHSALPRLADDDVVGLEAEHTIKRDDMADLKFRGTLIASVAPDSAPRGRWHEFRVYRTASGKRIFSRVGRSLLEGERDKFSATVFDPEVRGPWVGPDGVIEFRYKTDQAKRDAEKQALINFFEFGDLAKKLYAKLEIETADVVD
jgi:hypothetical protein